jgi:hypothetical protein
MAQHRGRRGFRVKHDARVTGTRLPDEFTELGGPLRRKAICIIRSPHPEWPASESADNAVTLIASEQFLDPSDHD